MAALINGADRFRAIPLPMLDGAAQLKKVLEEREPNRALVQMPNYLNTVTAYKVRNFTKQRYGFLLSATDRLTLRAETGEELGEIYALVRNEGEEISLFIKNGCSSGRCNGQTVQRRIEIAGHSSGWVPLWLQANGITPTLSIDLPNANVWIEGIRSVPDDARVLWPWNEHWSVDFHMRNWPVNRHERINFSPEALLRSQDGMRIFEYISTKNPVVSDRSGLIFMKTIYSE